MTHWREPTYWLWVWRRRVPFGAKVTVVAVVLCVLLGGGWAAADGLTSTHGGGDALALETTVEKLITVHEKGRIVHELVPAAEKVKARLKYVTVTASASGNVSAQTPARLPPVVRTQQITVNGESRTVTRTRLATTARTETATVARTVTSTQNITQPAVTVTQPAVTVTKPQSSTLTRTETRTETLTRTQTQPVTQTQTVTLPAQTVTVVQTVTVTVPKPK